MGDFFICPICGNQDQRTIGYLNGYPYCRKCVSFRGEEVKGNLIYPKSSYYHLDYDLSKEQKELSDALVSNYKNGIDLLVHAVCGSGKTEIVLEVISYAIRCGERVGFAVPRRDVVCELYERFHSIFKRNKIALVYGGHVDKLEGDLVCLTTHQLYRYDKYFDLLIVDEIDAFPFKGNDVLQAFFNRSIRGHFVMMSATPDEEVINSFKQNGKQILELFSRFHKRPLPVPEIVLHKSIVLYLSLYDYVKLFLRKNKPIFIFTPTIVMCEETYRYLKLFFKSGDYVHSKRINRPKVIEDFRQGKSKFLVTTAVLERGVTIKDLQVIIFHADNAIYDQYSLVQIAGRVGRKKDAPEGRVIFLANERTKDMEKAVEDIKRANASLQTMLSSNKS